MSKIKKRHLLSGKNSREIINKIRELYPELYKKVIATYNNPQIEYLLFDKFEVYVIERSPIILKLQENLFIPTINILNDKVKEILPKVVVDDGAIRHIINGADVMAPGIIEIKDFFNENEIVQIVECNHNITIAIGKALFSSTMIHTIKHGKVIRNLHHVGDKIWVSLKHHFPNS
ncbi:MAG: DUF1947 domain-containing protein [Candidatus Methanomethylicia archaeon]